MEKAEAKRRYEEALQQSARLYQEMQMLAFQGKCWQETRVRFELSMKNQTHWAKVYGGVIPA